MATANGKCPLILVADKEKGSREAARRALEEEGFEVATAANGERALELAAKRTPDLVVLDATLPKADGIEVTKKLRKRKKTGETPIIVLSALTQREDVELGLDAGADEYIAKPVVADDLQSAVRSLLRAPSEPDDTDGQELPVPLVTDEDGDPAGPGGTILVAGTDEHVVELARYRLELGGYAVSTASSLETAAGIVGESVPDLCVVESDDGIDVEALAEALGEAASGEIPVVKLEGQLDPQELFTEVQAKLGH